MGLFYSIEEKVQLPNNGSLLDIRSWAVGPFYRYVVVDCGDTKDAYRTGAGMAAGCVYNGDGNFTVPNTQSEVSINWIMGFPWWMSHMTVSVDGQPVWRWYGHPFGKANSEYVTPPVVTPTPVTPVTPQQPVDNTTGNTTVQTS